MNALLVAGIIVLAFWLEGRRRATARRRARRIEHWSETTR